MVVFDKLFLAFYFLAVMIVQGYWQKALFDRDITISHKKHTIYYGLTTLPVMYFFWPMWWQVLLIALIERIALFDILLNLIRHKTPVLTYNGRGTTGSIIDRWENSLANWALAGLKMTYIVIFIVVLILI